MRTLVTVLAMLWCWCWCGLAQMPPRVMQDMQEAYVSKPSAAGWTDNYYPTNIPGSPAYGWWVAEHATGPAVTNWPDYSGFDLHMTNVAMAANLWKSNAFLNGRAIIHMATGGASLVLKNTLYTNVAPCEYVVIGRLLSAGGAIKFWYGNAATLNNGGFGSDKKNQTGAGGFGTRTGDVSATNTWIMFNYVFSDSVGKVFTNGVQDSVYGTGQNALTTTGQGQFWTPNVTLGLIDYAEIVTYTNILSDAARTALWVYYQNKYGL